VLGLCNCGSVVGGIVVGGYYGCYVLWVLSVFVVDVEM
jgi:predicted nucleic acid-binding Zn finger protein